MRPELAKAFQEAMRDITSNIRLASVRAAIDSRDMEAMYRALNLSPKFYQPLAEAMRASYIGGGNGLLTAMPLIADPNGIGPLQIRFDGRSLRSEEWLRTKSASRIDDLIDGSREAVQRSLEAGRILGHGTDRMALDLAGRMDGGARRGGLVTLNRPQADAVIAARDDLANLNKRYFTRERRDRRFDAQVRRAIESGKPLPQATIDKIAGRYSDRLLQLRAQNIARTETVGALNAGRIEGVQQLIDEGAVASQDVRKVWNWSGKSNPREWHRDMHGDEVDVDEKFTTPKGNQIAYPCDPDAPAIETVSCGCYLEMRIDYIAAYGRTKRTAAV